MGSCFGGSCSNDAVVAFDAAKTNDAVAIAGGGRGPEVRFLGPIAGLIGSNHSRLTPSEECSG
jgi:hypothetical protein